MQAETERLNLLLQLRRNAEAEEFARECLGRNPDWAVGFSYLAQALLAQQKLDEALVEAKNGVAKAPLDTWCLAVLGDVLDQTGNREGAKLTYRQALRIDPYDCYSRMAFGFQLLNIGKYFDALQLAHDGLEQNPESEELLILLIHAELARGDLEDAKMTIVDALRLHPDLPALHVLAGRYHESCAGCVSYIDSLIDLRAAENEYREALRKAPTDHAIQCDLRRVSEQCQHLENEISRLPAIPEIVDSDTVSENHYSDVSNENDSEDNDTYMDSESNTVPVEWKDEELEQVRGEGELTKTRLEKYFWYFMALIACIALYCIIGQFAKTIMRF